MSFSEKYSEHLSRKQFRVLSQLKKMGYEPLGGTADDFNRYVASELRKWTAAVEAAGVQKK